MTRDELRQALAADFDEVLRNSFLVRHMWPEQVKRVKAEAKLFAQDDEAVDRLLVILEGTK